MISNKKFYFPFFFPLLSFFFDDFAFFVQCLKSASASDIPVFNNLVQLEISFGNYSWNLLTNLLQQSHKLETLIIYKVC